MTASRSNRKTLLVVLTLAAALAAACGDPGSSGGTAGSSQSDVVDEALYVLDPNGESETTRVVRVDPESGRIERSYPTGYDPAMALSPDGSQLYLASARREGKELRDVLTVLDTTRGVVLQEASVTDRWEGVGLTLHPTMVTSPDGRWLYLLQGRLLGADSAAYSVATYDTVQGEYLEATVPLDGCGPGILVPSGHAGGRRLQVACPLSHDIRIVDVASDGDAAATRVVPLPQAQEERLDANRNPLELWRLSSAVLAGGGDELYAVAQDGQVHVVDLVEGTIGETVDLDLGADEFVAIGQAEIGAGGSLFLGRGTMSDGVLVDRLNATAVMVVDPSTWEVGQVVVPENGFTSMTGSSVEDGVFTVDREHGSVALVRAREGSAAVVVRRVGGTPTLAETAPELGS